MKILYLNLSDHAIPPPTNVIRADTYISVALAEGMKKKGHDVSFVCPRGSTIGTDKIFSLSGPLVSVIPLEEISQIKIEQVRAEITQAFYVDMYLQLLESAHKFDIVHIHTNVPLSELVISKKISIPCVFTIHSISRLPDIEGRIMKNFSSINNYFISISNKQRTTFSSLNFTKTIYHGVDTHKFSFDLEGGLNMLFTGRLRNNKGVKEAIETAVISKHKILVAGALSSTDHDYFDHEIKPRSQKYKELLDVDIEPNRELINLKYQKAKLTLLPIKWEEPFGLVMIESMACGTPVVAFARGSVPEIIKDGETGFIVNSSPEDIRGDWIVKKTGIEGLCEAVEKIYAMPEEKYRAMRHACRAHVEDNFNIEKMIENYEQLYYEILKKQVNKLNYG